MLTIRSLMESDSDLLFNWRNNPKIYEFLFSPKPVEKKEHEDWFHKINTTQKTKIFIGIYEEMPCGMVKFDINEKQSEAEVGIYIDPIFFGKGIGGELLGLAEEEFKRTSGIKKIIARVLNENISSKKMFLKNNYELKYSTFEKEI